jgi:beta-glucosidase-like glycosyl hydrolase
MVSPTIVLMRGWHWGRAAESFGEDPYLTAEMLVPELQGDFRVIRSSRF